MSTAEPLQPAGGVAGPIGPAAPRQRQPVVGNFLGLEYKWLVAIAVIFGLFMAVLDTTVVNIALPKLQAVFGATLNDVQWIITGYTLAQTVSIPLFGFLADRFGSKWIYILSLGLFTVASALCGLSWSVNSMIFFRILQGLGGGALLPIGIAQVYAVFPPEERGRSQSAIGIPVLLAPALGPTLGGYIVQHFDWRLIFYINVPIGIILGMTLSTLTFASLVYGVGEAASAGWYSSTVIGFGIFGLFCLVALIIVELRTEDPLLDFSIFKSWNWTSAVLITVATTFALFGALFLVPQYLQVLRGLTPIQSGLILLPSSLVTVVALPISGILVDRFGPKMSILIGLVALGIASYLLSGLTLATPTALIQLWLIGRSVGIGFATQPASVIAFSDVPPQKLARGSAFFTVLRLVSSAFVTSFLATYVKNRALPHYAHLAEQTTVSSPLYTYLSGVVGQAALQGSWALPIQARVLRQVALQLRLQATVMAYRDALLLITGGIAVAFVLAFFVGNPRPRGGGEIME